MPPCRVRDLQGTHAEVGADIHLLSKSGEGKEKDAAGIRPQDPCHQAAEEHAGQCVDRAAGSVPQNISAGDVSLTAQ